MKYSKLLKVEMGYMTGRTILALICMKICLIWSILSVSVQISSPAFLVIGS